MHTSVTTVLLAVGAVGGGRGRQVRQADVWSLLARKSGLCYEPQVQ